MTNFTRLLAERVIQLESYQLTGNQENDSYFITYYLKDIIGFLQTLNNSCIPCGKLAPKEEYHSECGNCHQHCSCTQCGNCLEKGPDVYLCNNCDYCETCCNDRNRCRWCEYCELNHAAGDVCGECYTCFDRCQCFYCGECDSRDQCRECDRCVHCDCECEERAARNETTVERISMTNQPFHVVKERKLAKYNPFRRLVAAEIEVCGTRGDNGREISNICKKWGANIVSDGSLPSNGYEINTAPAGGDFWIYEITEICDALANQKAWVDHRAGCHVHIDARDFTHYDMRRLIIYYAKIEPILFSMLPTSRRESRYCYPCGKKYLEGISANQLPKKSKDKVISNIYGVEPAAAQKRKNQRYDDARYNALNIHSFFVRGTVECRILPGTINKLEIIPWGKMWAGILDFAYRSRERDITAIDVSTMERRKEALLLSTKTNDVKEMIDNKLKEFNSGMQELRLDSVGRYY